MIKWKIAALVFILSAILLNGCSNTNTDNPTSIDSLSKENVSPTSTLIPIITVTPLPTPIPKIEQEETAQKDYASIGFDIMKIESLGPLKLGVSYKDIQKSIGDPQEKSEAITWGADGEVHQSWYYKKIGIELDMIYEGDKRVVNMIKIKSPCDYKTQRGIGIGSDKDEVLRVYKGKIDLNENSTDPTTIVVGTIYGGIIFNVENNNVSEIFIGAAAE